MKRWIGITALLCTAPAGAEQTLFGPMRNGASIACADLTEVQTTTTSATGYWILGFWSGLNAANDALVGDSTTPSGVIGEVKLYCASHPSISLPQATLDTYVAMRKPHRR